MGNCGENETLINAIGIYPGTERWETIWQFLTTLNSHQVIWQFYSRYRSKRIEEIHSHKTRTQCYGSIIHNGQKVGGNKCPSTDDG